MPLVPGDMNPGLPKQLFSLAVAAFCPILSCCSMTSHVPTEKRKSIFPFGYVFLIIKPPSSSSGEGPSASPRPGRLALRGLESSASLLVLPISYNFSELHIILLTNKFLCYLTGSPVFRLKARIHPKSFLIPQRTRIPIPLTL